MRDEKTSRGWPLPHKENTLADDVERIRTTFQAINSELSTLEENILQNLQTGFNERISAIEAKIEQGLVSPDQKTILDFFEEYGLYIDDDGDICQDLSGGGGQSTTTDPDNPAVIIDGETVPLATQEDVQELLNELDLGQ